MWKELPPGKLRGPGRLQERRQDLRFSSKSSEPGRIQRKGAGQNLESHFAIQLRVSRPIHFSHSAGAEKRQHFVSAEAAANP